MAHSANYLADPSGDYDKWAQAYRMLGGFIDCDHDKEASHSNDRNNNNGQSGCARWMLWAAVSATLIPLWSVVGSDNSRFSPVWALCHDPRR